MRKVRSGMTWREPSFMKRVWDLTWGLVLVAGLTAISEFGVRVGYSKTAPDAPVVSQPTVQVVK